METIIVTIMGEGLSVDLELPWLIPLEELYPRLHTVLKKIKPNPYEKYTGVLFERNEKGLLTLTASLADYGIRMGDYLKVVEEGKYYVN